LRAEDEQAFREFVTFQMASLRKLAYLTCGDWHMAEDAVANALVKLYPRWRKLERPDLYVKTMVYRAAIDETRRPRQRAAVILRHYLDLSLEDTAGVLGCNVGTAKSQTSRGLAKLRDLLSAERINLTGEAIEEWNSAVA
jgi:DNA-directed RNA polymerase specialized sigma24 family protein